MHAQWTIIILLSTPLTQSRYTKKTEGLAQSKILYFFLAH